MLKDITLGQYFPGNTVIHRLDPRTKLIATVCYIVGLFCAEWFVTYGLTALFLLLCVRLSRVPFRSLVRGLKPVLFILTFTAVLNLFYTPGEELWRWWIFKITREGVTADDLFDAAIRRGLMIRNCASFPFLDNKYFRFCFMMPNKNDELLALIKEMLG